MNIAFGGIGCLVVVGALLAARVFRTIDQLSQRVDAVAATYRRDFQIFEREKLSGLRKLAEEQDALIAAIWHRTFGHRTEERFGDAEWAKYYDTAPPWYSTAMNEPNVYDTLCRRDPYPWGSRAEWLRFPAVPRRPTSEADCPEHWLGFLIEDLSFGGRKRFRISIPNVQDDGFNRWKWSQDFDTVESLLDFCFENGEKWWSEMQKASPPDRRFYGLYPYMSEGRKQRVSSI